MPATASDASVKAIVVFFPQGVEVAEVSGVSWDAGRGSRRDPLVKSPNAARSAAKLVSAARSAADVAQTERNAARI